MSESLEELDRLEREATPGPWLYVPDGESVWHEEGDLGEGLWSHDLRGLGVMNFDQEFMVALRNNARSLIDAAKREKDSREFCSGEFPCEASTAACSFESENIKLKELLRLSMEYFQDDEGPPGEGWKSRELIKLTGDIEAATGDV